MRRIAGLACLLAFACGDDTTVVDAGGDVAVDVASDVATIDVATDTALDVPVDAPADLAGPNVAFVNEETCFTTSFASDVYRFTWGDGERADVSEPEACHTWTFPGTFLVSVEAGPFDASRPLRVVPRPADVAPRASSPVLVDPVTNRAWAVVPDADHVVVVDLETLERETILPTCAGPRTVTLSGRSVAVACERASQVTRFGADELDVLGVTDLGPGTMPFGVVGDVRASDVFFVTLRASGELVRIEDGSVTDRLDVGTDPRALVLGGDGRLLVTRWRSTSDGGVVVHVDAAAEPVVVREVPLPPEDGLDSDTNNNGVPSFLDSILLTPDGERALVGALKANVVTGTFRNGRELESQTTARAIVVELLQGRDPGDPYDESFRFVFDDLDFASALVSTPLGDRVFVAIMGSQRVIALEPFNFDVVGSIANVGVAPRGLAIDGAGRLLVLAELSRELRVYDVVDLSGEPPLLATISLVDTEPLEVDVLRGKQIFHTSVDPRMSRTSYLSCASCHLDGEGDNLVWDFTQRGEGLRNTIDLAGRAGDRHGRMHWTGNFDEIQDFEADIRLHQGGEGFLSESDWLLTRDSLGPSKTGLSSELDALAAYVSSLDRVGTSPLRRTDAAFLAERARGESLFTAAGCPSCHETGNYTDSPRLLRHDVGTLGPGSGRRLGGILDGLDTPTLLGLWRTAPYLHDGSATLREVLTTRNVGDAHGTTSGLSETDLGALELFLLTLDDA